MNELQKWCKSEGITAIDVQLFENNKLAEEVYRKLGFTDYRVVLRQEVAPGTGPTG
jgi:GNAT superfamily N-acetyltransferase